MGRMCEMVDGTQQEYMSCAETATALRQALATTFPGVKFSVRSKTYSGGASIIVRWSGGPRRITVAPIVRPFKGADFDGMQDLKTYRTAVVNGQKVHWGADFIFMNREGIPCAQCEHVDDMHDVNPDIGCRADNGIAGRSGCLCRRFEVIA